VSTLIEQHHEFLWESNSFERSVVERVLQSECFNSSAQSNDAIFAAVWGVGRAVRQRCGASGGTNALTGVDCRPGPLLSIITARGKSKITFTYRTCLM
jgi:hypothetical protein